MQDTHIEKLKMFSQLSYANCLLIETHFSTHRGDTHTHFLSAIVLFSQHHCWTVLQKSRRFSTGPLSTGTQLLYLCRFSCRVITLLLLWSCNRHNGQAETYCLVKKKKKTKDLCDQQSQPYIKQTPICINRNIFLWQAIAEEIVS